MTFAIRLCIACLFSCALLAQAQTQKKDAFDVELLVKKYGESWGMTDPVERRAALKKIWVDEGVHESPFGRSEGIEAIHQEIDGFIKAYPNATIRLTNIRRTGNNILCDFSSRKSDGSILFEGVDYFEVNDKGLLRKAVGFVRQ